MAFSCAHAKKRQSEDDLPTTGAQYLGPSLENKLDELTYQITYKIDQEMSDSKNAREYITQKYDELCNKIKFLTEMDATVTGFRSDVKAVEEQIALLAARVDDIEQRTIAKECPSITSSYLHTHN